MLMHRHPLLLVTLVTSSLSCGYPLLAPPDAMVPATPIATPSAHVAATAIPEAPCSDVGTLMNVIDHGHTRWAVIGVAPEGAEWQSGEPTLVERGDVVVTRTGVRMAALPSAMRGMQGREVQLYSATGPACRARLGELSLM